MPMDRESIDRFWSKVDRRTPGECWVWKASTVRGYGQVRIGGRNGRLWRAHRLAYELAHGPIPDGLLVCHRCDNPPCCNPEHLFLGTAADNNRDCADKGRSARGDRNGSRRYPERLRGRARATHVARGSQHWRAQLDEPTVFEILREYLRGGVSQRALAKMHGVTQSAISRVISGRRWPHISRGEVAGAIRS